MKYSEFFEREIQLIESEDLRDFVRWFFDTHVGKWFWVSGASASGKYHPEFTKGDGGLVRHTRAVAWMLEELLRMSTYAYMRAEYKDLARVACLLHDTRKYGMNDEIDKSAYKNHGRLASNAVAIAWQEFFNERAPELLLMAIKSHMGQWTEDRDERPFTNIDRVVHMADYVASRPFFDIPALSEQFDLDAIRFYAENKYPFFAEPYNPGC